ncbi:ArsR family transcriptional regulator [Halobellus captivus]|uniref:ArsR family transcriptional regulator n=1 Tax=Halobellus captivus TaxID=2592614 RepID=UPI0011A25AE3|nr:ArsR family transcriptional regulator [Halobellus captivus]
MLGHKPNAEETDRAMNILSHSCRRRLLFELYEQVNSGGGESISYIGLTPLGTEKKRTLLYHAHLPKLEESGYITWNEAEKTIQRGSRWEEIEPLLELIYSHLYELPPFLQGTRSDKNGMKC